MKEGNLSYWRQRKKRLFFICNFTLYILLFTLYLPFLCWFYATLVFTVEINPFKPLSKPFRLTIMQRSGSAFIAMHCLSVAGNGAVTFYALPPCATHNSPLSHPTTKVHGHCSPNLSQVHCTPYSYSVSTARHCLNWIFHRPLECKGMDDKCIASTIFTRTKTKTKQKEKSAALLNKDFPPPLAG